MVPDPLPRPSLAGAAGALIAAAFAAWILHHVPGRAGAAQVVPVAWAWGACALVAAWTAGEARIGLGWVLAAAIGVRIVLVGAPPLLSDDLFRYLWEGALLNAGGNPFVQAPASVAGLDDALRDHVNHGDLTSIYPPVALTWFRLLDVLGRAPWVAQATAAAADVGTVLALRAVLRARGGPDWPAWCYALHPLPALESAVGAHVDVLAIALAAAGVAAWVRERRTLAVFATVLGAGVKLFPALLLPAMSTREGRRREWAGLGLGGVVVALLALQVDPGPDPLASWRLYRDTWSFNGFAFPLVEPWLGVHTRTALLVTGGAVVAWAWWRRREPVGVWAAAGGAFVLLSPTVHPWYVLWALVPALMSGGWAWALASLPLLGSYLVLATWDAGTGGWTVQPWLWWATWGPAIAVLLAVGWARGGPDLGVMRLARRARAIWRMDARG